MDVPVVTAAEQIDTYRSLVCLRDDHLDLSAVTATLKTAAGFLRDPTRLWASVPSWLEPQAPVYEPSATRPEAAAILTFIADARATMVRTDISVRDTDLAVDTGAWRLAAQIVTGDQPSPEVDLVGYCRHQSEHPQTELDLDGCDLVRCDAELGPLVVAMTTAGIAPSSVDAGSPMLDLPASVTFSDLDILHRFVTAVFGNGPLLSTWQFRLRTVPVPLTGVRFCLEASFPLNTVPDIVTQLRKAEPTHEP